MHCETCKCQKGKQYYDIAIDFDGPIHSYSKGLHDGTIYDGVIEGIIDVIKRWEEKKIVIFTCREKKQVKKWLEDLSITLQITNMKPMADVYIDDKAFKWEGWNEELIQNVEGYLQKEGKGVFIKTQVDEKI